MRLLSAHLSSFYNETPAAGNRVAASLALAEISLIYMKFKPDSSQQNTHFSEQVIYAALLLAGLFRSFLKPINHDAAWYLYGSSRVLDGARLYRDIIDINPPLIFYFNFPAVVAARVFQVDEVLAWRLFIACLLVLSLWLSQRLVYRIFPPPDARRHYLAVALLIGCSLHLGYNYGQREHIMVLLVLPYIMRCILCAQKQEVSRRLAILIGASAGLGFALKPHFLLLWAGLELYLFFQRGWRSAWRPETAVIGAITIPYAALVPVLFPGYVKVALLATEVYGAFNAPWRDLLQGPTARFWLLGLGASFLVWGNRNGRQARSVLAVAATCCFIIALVQRKGWEYQFYPTEAMIIALLGLTVPELTGKVSSWLRYVPAPARILASLALFYFGASQLFYFKAELWRYSPPAPTALINIVRANAARQPIAVLTPTIDPGFPTVNYTKSIWSLRLPSLWMLAAIYKNAPSRYHPESEMSNAERFTFRTVVQDLLRTPPQLLIVDVSPQKWNFGSTHFDFLEYFSADERFRQLLTDDYAVLTTVDSFTVYKRKPHPGSP